MSHSKISKVLITGAMSAILCSSIFLTGCMGGGEEQTGTQVAQTNIQINLNAENDMCNDALKLTVTGIQRRPTSIFAGSDIATSQMAGTNASEVSVANSNDIAIQVDVSFRWNINTYTSAVTAAGGQPNTSSLTTLGALLQPGSLMYVEGVDSDGNIYQSADIITPAQQENVNALSIDAQWDYDVLNSDLPETSVTKTGSFLIRVPSTVQDLKLIIQTPTSGQPIDRDISGGGTYIYELPLA